LSAKGFSTRNKVLGLLGVIYLCWKHGDVGSNQYGGVPDPKRDVFKAILNT
jgi:hypothetical protein